MQAWLYPGRIRVRPNAAAAAAAAARPLRYVVSGERSGNCGAQSGRTRKGKKSILSPPLSPSLGGG